MCFYCDLPMKTTVVSVIYHQTLAAVHMLVTGWFSFMSVYVLACWSFSQLFFLSKILKGRGWPIVSQAHCIPVPCFGLNHWVTQWHRVPVPGFGLNHRVTQWHRVPVSGFGLNHRVTQWHQVPVSGFGLNHRVTRCCVPALGFGLNHSYITHYVPALALG